MVRIGECSSHSPGCLGGGTTSASPRSTSIPIASAVTAVLGPGADQIAMTTEIARRTAVTATDCQRKIVSENGMTPVMGNRLLGRLAALACNCAAEDDRPIAQVAPSPR